MAAFVFIVTEFSRRYSSERIFFISCQLKILYVPNVAVCHRFAIETMIEHTVVGQNITGSTISFLF